MNPVPSSPPQDDKGTAGRRGFLGMAAAGLAGVMLAPGIRLIEVAQAAPTAGADPQVRWGMLIDSTKCST
ncbi:MAG: twin-arginine translocation signal domain-containing protein, partial [Hydrogenophaga sp.]|nr:twin-arginine translocation signal domain-containing protein [Hydrogenophaga sp.]